MGSLMRNYILYKIMDIITYSCPRSHLNNISKTGPIRIMTATQLAIGTPCQLCIALHCNYPSAVKCRTGWRHNVETLSALVDFAIKNSPVTVGYILQSYWTTNWVAGDLEHISLGLTLFCTCRSPPGPIKEIEGFATHICVTREMRAVFHAAYMRHQAKMSHLGLVSHICSSVYSITASW